MSRIVIDERNYTAPIAQYNTTDVVFVPGFSVAQGASAAPQGVPTLCSSLAEFIAYFGNANPTFATAQAFPADSGSFPASSLPEGNMFASNDSDPGYRYAKLLLQNGLPVVYERMNDGVAASDITVEKAYAYLSSNVFAASRTHTITYAASEYSKTKSYNVGDIVKRTATTTSYYKCKVAYVVPEGEEHEFNLSEWDELPTSYLEENPISSLSLSIKYITSGGYPTHEFTPKNGSSTLANMMTSIAATRGDCLALVDYVDNSNRALIGAGSIYESAIGITNGASSAMVVPWFKYELESLHMPGSFAYLMALANMLSTYPNWFAVAGINRGTVPGLIGLCTKWNLTNSIAETTFQPESGVSINGITNIANYGYRIWGNRTLITNGGGTTALSFINIRNMVSDIKKTLYNAALTCLFEPNSDSTWINFTSKVAPFLDKLVDGQGITRYSLDRVKYDETGAQLPQTTMRAVLTIYPLYSIEKFSITIAIRDDDTIEVS